MESRITILDIGPLVTNRVQATQLHHNDAASIRKRGTSGTSITNRCLIALLGPSEAWVSRAAQRDVSSRKPHAWGVRPEVVVFEVRVNVVGDT